MIYQQTMADHSASLLVVGKVEKQKQRILVYVLLLFFHTLRATNQTSDTTV